MSVAKSNDPPAATRFRKGQSGNPKGRPRKAKAVSSSAFDVIVDRTLTVTRDGVVSEVSVEEALLHRTYQDAIAGKRLARREVLKMIAKREKARADRDGKRSPKIERLYETVDPRNANTALLLLGIACRDVSWPQGLDDPTERLLLEPWAVQAAISRRRGGSRLSERDVETIKRCTRDAETLRWPRTVEE